jgi:hypothetical protein
MNDELVDIIRSSSKFCNPLAGTFATLKAVHESHAKVRRAVKPSNMVAELEAL